MQTDPETPAPEEPFPALPVPRDLGPLPPSEPVSPEGASAPVPLASAPAPLVAEPALLASAPAFPEPARVPLASAPVALPAPPAAVAAVPAVAPHASMALLVTLSISSMAADLVTKAWAKGHLAAGADLKTPGLKKIEIVKGHIDLIFAQNPGGAWSFLRSLPDSLRRPFFLIVSAAAIVFIITVYQRVRSDQWGMKLGLPLALGGAIGNLVDRIRYGWVIDFIDYRAAWMRWVTAKVSHTPTDHWPTFNVADIAIVIGVALMAISLLRVRAHHHHDGREAVSPLSF